MPAAGRLRRRGWKFRDRGHDYGHYRYYRNHRYHLKRKLGHYLNRWNKRRHDYDYRDRL
jgi:hypothetical protein